MSRLHEERKQAEAAFKQELDAMAKERKEEVDQWKARLDQERGHWKEELSLIQEDRGIMITKLTEKDLALDELREQLALQQSEAQQQIQALKQVRFQRDSNSSFARCNHTLVLGCRKRQSGRCHQG